MKIYLAGKMSGKPNANRETFHKYAKQLRVLGHDVWSPAEQDDNDIESLLPEKGIEWVRREFLKRDIPVLYKMDAVALIEDWAESQGALFEIYNALWMGKPVLYAHNLQPIPKEILQMWLMKELLRITDGQPNLDSITKSNA